MAVTRWPLLLLLVGLAGALGDPPPVPPDVVMLGSDGAQSRGGRWALVIGIDHYADRSLGRLGAAVADAKRLYACLTTVAGYSPEQTLLFTGEGLISLAGRDSARQPTYTELRGQIATFTEAHSNSDMLLIYFAGHGFHSDTPDRDYLGPSDVQRADLEHTAIPVDEILQRMKQSGARQSALIVDACRDVPGRGARPRSIGVSRTSVAAGEALGIWYLASCGPGETSQEDPAHGGGIYTSYLLEALGGGADENIDGLVTVNEAARYVHRKVNAWTRVRPPLQSPAGSTLDARNGELVLSVPQRGAARPLLGSAPPRIDVAFLRNLRSNPALAPPQRLDGAPAALRQTDGVVSPATGVVADPGDDHYVVQTAQANYVVDEGGLLKGRLPPGGLYRMAGDKRILVADRREDARAELADRRWVAAVVAGPDWPGQALAADCSLLALASPGELALMDREGQFASRRKLPRPAGPAGAEASCSVTWSPDGRRLAVLVEDGQAALYVSAVDGTSTLVSTESMVRCVWAPDGTALAGVAGDHTVVWRLSAETVTIPGMFHGWACGGALGLVSQVADGRASLSAFRPGTGERVDFATDPGFRYFSLVAVSPEGQHAVATAHTADGTRVFLLRFPEADWVRQAGDAEFAERCRQLQPEPLAGEPAAAVWLSGGALAVGTAKAPAATLQGVRVVPLDAPEAWSLTSPVAGVVVVETASRAWGIDLPTEYRVLRIADGAAEPINLGDGALAAEYAVSGAGDVACLVAHDAGKPLSQPAQRTVDVRVAGHDGRTFTLPAGPVLGRGYASRLAWFQTRSGWHLAVFASPYAAGHLLSVVDPGGRQTEVLPVAETSAGAGGRFAPPGSFSGWFCSVSPDGSRIALAGRHEWDYGLYVLDALSGRLDSLCYGAVSSDVGWTSDQKLWLFHQEWAASEPRPEAGGTLGEVRYARFPAVSADGQHVAYQDAADRLWVARVGEPAELVAEAVYRQEWSPQGDALAFTREDGLYLKELDGRQVRFGVDTSAEDFWWSPDGRELVVATGAGADAALWRWQPQAGGKTQLSAARPNAVAWHPGQPVIAVCFDDAEGGKIDVVNLADAQRTPVFRPTPRRRLDAAYGRALAWADGGRILLFAVTSLDEHLQNPATRLIGRVYPGMDELELAPPGLHLVNWSVSPDGGLVSLTTAPAPDSRQTSRYLCAADGSNLCRIGNAGEDLPPTAEWVGGQSEVLWHGSSTVVNLLRTPR